MTHEIEVQLTEPGGEIDDLPRSGALGAEVIARDHEGKSLIEFVLPDRFADGLAVPFKASWWAVDCGELTPEDSHQVQEIWFVGRGAGEMRLGSERLSVRAGQAVHIPPSTLHQVRATSPEALGVFSVWW